MDCGFVFQYPEELGGVKVKYVRDLTTGYDNEQPDNKAVSILASTMISILVVGLTVMYLTCAYY